MGNKLGSRKPSDAPVESSNGRQKRPSEPRRSKSASGSALTSATASSSSPHENHQSNNSKIISCPDISHGGAVPYRYDDDRTVDIKIYRSFSDVAHEGNDSDPRRRNRTLLPGEPVPDIKVYRRSTGALLLQQGAFEVSSQTLPRSFGRSKSSVISTMPGNGTLPRELSGAAEHLLRQRHSTLGHSSSSLSRGSTRRLNSTFSITSIGYKVSVDDFPNSATIRRKLRQFESSFVRSLTDIYSSLPEKTQMGLLAIAICPDRANQPVTLWQYMNSSEPPFDLNADDPRRQHLLTIPDYLYTSLAKLRNEDVTDPATWLARGREVMTSVAVEAANEISRVFEYQITLLGDGLPIELLARHGVECVFEYLKQAGRHLDRNSIVHGVIRGQSRKTGPKSPKVSVLIGEKELKWTVHEVFKLPGMRKDMFLVSNEIQVNSDQSPWKYYVAPAESDPLLYGYRGLVIDWDFASSAYRINGEDEASFSQEAEWNLDDFHRQYLPYRRLIGVQVVQDFCRQRDEALGNVDESPNRTSLADFVKKVQGESNSRDDIQPVYRPLDGTDSKVLPCLDRINLGGTDVCRVLMRNQSNSRSSYPPEQATSNTGSSTVSNELDCTDGMLQSSEQSQKVDKRPVTITLSAVKNFFDTDPGSPTRSSPTSDRTSKQGARISGSPLLNGTDGAGSSISSAPENSPLSSADESRGVRGRNGNVEYKIETVTYRSVDVGSVIHTVPEIARNTVRSDV